MGVNSSVMNYVSDLDVFFSYPKKIVLNENSHYSDHRQQDQYKRNMQKICGVALKIEFTLFSPSQLRKPG